MGTLGGDEALFSVSAEGELSYISAPDYEAPNSQETNNTYSVRLIAEDGRGGTDTQDLTITVTDLTEGSTLELNATDGATFEILQGNSYLFDAIDSEDDDITYTLVTNGHAAGVTLDSETGLLSVAAAAQAATANVSIRAESTNPDNSIDYDIETYSIVVRDITPPSLTISAESNSLTLGGSTTIHFNFTEAVSGFTIDDITIGGSGTLDVLSGSSSTYSTTYYAGQSDETDSISVAIGSFEDALGQTNQAEASISLAVGGLSATYGNYFSAFGSSEIIQGTSGTDTITIGDYAANHSGELVINGAGGDDLIKFEHRAATGQGSSITINNGNGDGTYEFGRYAASDNGLLNLNGIISITQMEIKQSDAQYNAAAQVAIF